MYRMSYLGRQQVRGLRVVPTGHYRLHALDAHQHVQLGGTKTLNFSSIRRVEDSGRTMLQDTSDGVQQTKRSR